MSLGVSTPNSKFHQTQLKILVQAWQQSSLLIVVIVGATETLFPGTAAMAGGGEGRLYAKLGSQYAGTVVAPALP